MTTIISERRKLYCGVGLAGMAAAVVILGVFDPGTSGIFPPCPVRYLTGWYCPGCGSLRAVHQLLHGNLQAALAMNPLTVGLLPFLTYELASHVVWEFRGRPLTRVSLPAAWIRGLAGVIILFGVARNLPMRPFELLAPGAMLHP
jgi:hypothetical protein